MAEIKNSALLDRLISLSLPENANNPTAEGLVLSALQLAVSQSAELTETEQAELQPFRAFFEKTGQDLSVLEQKLHNAVAEHQKTFSDALYLQEKLMKAKMLAGKEDAAELTADRLLLCILSQPSDLLRDCLELKGADPQPETPAPKSDADPFAATRQRLEAFMQSRSSEPREEAPAEQKESAPAQPLTPEQEKERMVSLVDVVKQTRATLMDRVYGQNHAISVLTDGYFRGELSALVDRHRTAPRSTFLFAGPSGVGKTFLAETAAEVLGLPFKRFDMSEYSDQEAVVQLCGADHVYKDSHAGVLTDFVRQNPKCLLLFDEIEKAHLNAIHLFLQLLDAGRLTDAYTKKEVSFVDTIVIFTTNAGKQLYQQSESNDLSGCSRKVILGALAADVNPLTGAPSFPQSICSRFAAGNVVMFNRMSAHDLRDIAKHVLVQQVEDLENGIGIKTQVDERVYTALLLAEGGSADARMVRGRALSFYHGELFELFRLVDSEKVNSGISDIETIRFSVDLPEDDAEISELFEPSADTSALVFSGAEAADWCRQSATACKLLSAETIDAAQELLQTNDIHFALVDLSRGGRESAYLNIEDIDSEARSFLHLLREQRPGLPVFLLLPADGAYTVEERVSFQRIGVQGFLEYGADGAQFDRALAEICDHLRQQSSIENLAKSNKLIRFETAQKLTDGGKTAEIHLFDFKLKVAVDSSDTKSVLSSVSRPNVRFADVIGAEDAKKELMYFVKYLQNPKKYTGTGVSAPKGVLLYGPPGTGKTLLAKAMACESGVTFLAAEGNQFLKKYVGEGPESVHELFRTARRYAPSILFVDEIDAIAKPRTGSEQSEAREEILTAFLTEMDGFRVDPAHPVFVLAATNFNVEPGRGASLDQAMMRRFDRRINVDLPNKEERIRYLRMQFGKKKIFDLSDEMIENIAIRSTGMSLAALASVIELSMRTMIRGGGMSVTDAIFEEAFETFHSGDEKKWDPAELERTARHEAGHAFLSWLSGDKPSYLTIVARSGHGGYMQHGDNESKGIYTRAELLARIRTALGGRAAEMVYYGEDEGVSTGASGDLATATDIARSIICAYGMDEDFGLAVIEPSGAGSAEVREAVNKILKAELENAIRSLRDHRGAVDALVSALLKENRLTGKQIDDILVQAASPAI